MRLLILSLENTFDFPMKIVRDVALLLSGAAIYFKVSFIPFLR